MIECLQCENQGSWNSKLVKPRIVEFKMVESEGSWIQQLLNPCLLNHSFLNPRVVEFKIVEPKDCWIQDCWIQGLLSPRNFQPISRNARDFFCWIQGLFNPRVVESKGFWIQGMLKVSVVKMSLLKPRSLNPILLKPYFTAHELAPFYHREGLIQMGLLRLVSWVPGMNTLTAGQAFQWAWCRGAEIFGLTKEWPGLPGLPGKVSAWWAHQRTSVFCN